MLRPVEIVTPNRLDLNYLSLYSYSAERLLTAEVMLFFYTMYDSKNIKRIGKWMDQIEKETNALSEDSYQDKATMLGIKTHDYIYSKN